ncbi:MAG: amino acid permease [Gammaproteobacteria bacterium]|nr:amino acid permease [Gammaproteobacteria bacterium]
MSTAESAGPGLLRAVSRWQIVGLALNDVIGSGVYLLPAAAAALLGAASIWAVLLAGFAVALLVLCFAQASSYFDQPGGAYLYTREAFGRFIGFEVGWMSWLARVASVASLANGLAQACTYFWPAAAGGWQRAAIISGPILLLGWINVRGVKAGARTAVALVIAKMLPLLFFIAVGLWFVRPSRLGALEPPHGGVLGQAALLLLFAYAGFENTPAAAGEYKNPRRDVPFALLAMILIVTLVYSLAQIVALGTLPGIAHSQSPLAEAARRFAGDWGAWLLSAGAIVSIAGNVGNTMLIGPRYLYALAADGYGPRWLARVHPQYRTPAAAIVAQTLIALALALSGSFVQLAMLSVIARLATYLGTAAAVPVLRRRFGDRPGAVRLPWGPAIPIAALLLSGALLASATGSNLIAGAGALAVGGGVYRLWRAVPVVAGA